jgi:hypothetical protein
MTNDESDSGPGVTAVIHFSGRLNPEQWVIVYLM